VLVADAVGRCVRSELESAHRSGPVTSWVSWRFGSVLEWLSEPAVFGLQVSHV